MIIKPEVFEFSDIVLDWLVMSARPIEVNRVASPKERDARAKLKEHVETVELELRSQITEPDDV